MEKDNKNIPFFSMCHFIVSWFWSDGVKTDCRAFDRREEIDTEACSAWKVNFLKKRWCRVVGEIEHKNFSVDKLMRVKISTVVFQAALRRNGHFQR